MNETFWNSGHGYGIFRKYAISEEVIYDDQEGTVYYKGTGLILKYLNGEEEPVIILGQDRIKIANEEYERI